MMTKKQLTDRLKRIRDSIDTDFLNRHDIEGVTKDINDLIIDISTEIGSIDVDEEDIGPYMNVGGA